MQNYLIKTVFILIGIVIGVILSLQIRAQPVKIGSFPLEQLNIQKALLTNFSLEQEDLKQRLASLETKLTEAKRIIERRTSRQMQKTLNQLKAFTGLNEVTGEGLRITLRDNPTVSRINFSTVNENFVQAPDLRDLVNGLFVKDAKAISVNGKRILPMTPIQSVFDSILVGNFQIGQPFVIEAVGNIDSLQEAVSGFKKRKLQIFVDQMDALKIPPMEGLRQPQYLSLNMP